MVSSSRAAARCSSNEVEYDSSPFLVDMSELADIDNVAVSLSFHCHISSIPHEQHQQWQFQLSDLCHGVSPLWNSPWTEGTKTSTFVLKYHAKYPVWRSIYITKVSKDSYPASCLFSRYNSSSKNWKCVFFLRSLWWLLYTAAPWWSPGRYELIYSTFRICKRGLGLWNWDI